MPSFIDKLSLDNLYPTSPRNKPRRNEDYPLFEKFKQEILPLLAMGQMEQTFAPINNIPNEPSKPMDVVFNDNNISEATRAMGAARTIHNVDLNRNALSPYQAGQLSLRDRELEQRNTLAKNKLGLDSKKVEIADFKARNKDHQFIQGKDGRLRAVNPLTKEVTDLGETGMSDIEVAALNQTNDLQKIDRTGEQSRELEKLRQIGDESLEAIKARHAKELSTHTGSIKADAERNAPILPSQERVAKLARVEEAKNTRPEWSKYIKTIPGGGYEITNPGRVFGPSRETYDAIIKFIGEPPEAIRTVNTSPGSSNSTVKKPQSKYQVEVRESK